MVFVLIMIFGCFVLGVGVGGCVVGGVVLVYVMGVFVGGSVGDDVGVIVVIEGVVVIRGLV